MSYPHNLTLVRKLRGLTLLLCAESSSRCQHNHIMCYLRLCAIKFIIQVMNLNVARVSLRTAPMEQKYAHITNYCQVRFKFWKIAFDKLSKKVKYFEVMNKMKTASKLLSKWTKRIIAKTTVMVINSISFKIYRFQTKPW